MKLNGFSKLLILSLCGSTFFVKNYKKDTLSLVAPADKNSKNIFLQEGIKKKNLMQGVFENDEDDHQQEKKDEEVGIFIYPEEEKYHFKEAQKQIYFAPEVLKNKEKLNNISASLKENLSKNIFFTAFNEHMKRDKNLASKNDTLETKNLSKKSHNSSKQSPSAIYEKFSIGESPQESAINFSKLKLKKIESLLARNFEIYIVQDVPEFSDFIFIKPIVYFYHPSKNLKAYHQNEDKKTFEMLGFVALIDGLHRAIPDPLEDPMMPIEEAYYIKDQKALIQDVLKNYSDQIKSKNILLKSLPMVIEDDFLIKSRDLNIKLKLEEPPNSFEDIKYNFFYKVKSEPIAINHLNYFLTQNLQEIDIQSKIFSKYYHPVYLHSLSFDNHAVIKNLKDYLLTTKENIDLDSVISFETEKLYSILDDFLENDLKTYDISLQPFQKLNLVNKFIKKYFKQEKNHLYLLNKNSAFLDDDEMFFYWVESKYIPMYPIISLGPVTLLKKQQEEKILVKSSIDNLNGAITKINPIEVFPNSLINFNFEAAIEKRFDYESVHDPRADKMHHTKVLCQDFNYTECEVFGDALCIKENIDSPKFYMAYQPFPKSIKTEGIYEAHYSFLGFGKRTFGENKNVPKEKSPIKLHKIGEKHQAKYYFFNKKDRTCPDLYIRNCIRYKNKNCRPNVIFHTTNVQRSEHYRMENYKPIQDIAFDLPLWEEDIKFFFEIQDNNKNTIDTFSCPISEFIKNRTKFEATLEIKNTEKCTIFQDNYDPFKFRLVLSGFSNNIAINRLYTLGREQLQEKITKVRRNAISLDYRRTYFVNGIAYEEKQQAEEDILYDFYAIIKKTTNAIYSKIKQQTII